MKGPGESFTCVRMPPLSLAPPYAHHVFALSWKSRTSRGFQNIFQRSFRRQHIRLDLGHRAGRSHLFDLHLTCTCICASSSLCSGRGLLLDEGASSTELVAQQQRLLVCHPSPSSRREVGVHRRSTKSSGLMVVNTLMRRMIVLRMRMRITPVPPTRTCADVK